MQSRSSQQMQDLTRLIGFYIYGSIEYLDIFELNIKIVRNILTRHIWFALQVATT